MKKFLFSLLTLAAALTVASCQKELQAGPNGEGPAVNASFAVSLGDAMTKAFADGTTVDKVYAALYEVGSDGAYTFVAEADPAEITDLKATVQINGKLKKGKSYRVAFWAQKAAEAAAEGSTAAPAASAYKVVWDPAPVVTVTPTGAANDEARDAFYGVYDTGEVKGNITAEKVIPLVRPFAQVNVLVPVGNLSADAAITSSMTIKQAPTTLNLNTGETGTPADYVFATAPMAEPAFGTYAQTHKYVAMNYVLVDQAAQNHYHDVEFSVTAGDDNTGETPKSLNVPLKSNVRTNIVGNIFESFGFNGTVVVTPEGSEVEATDIRIAVGTAGTSAEDPIDVTANGTLVTFAISRPVDREETPDITYKKGGVVTATWDSASKGINILPAQGVENGSDVVTVTFPQVTKTTYAEGKVDVYVKVGTGEDPVVNPTITVSDAPAEAVSEAFDLTVTTNSSGAVTAALATAEGAATSAATIEKKSGPTESEGNYVWVFTVTPANDLSEDASVVATFTVAEVANAFNEGSETATFTVAKAAGSGDQPGTGSGTLADPYTIAGVKAYIDGLEGASDDVYIKGKISKIQSPYSESYGTAIFFISDDGTETDNDFEAYSVYFLENESWVEGNTQIQVKDEVILCGKVKKYNSTYETDSKKAYVYSLNNVTTEFVPIKVSASDVTNVPAAGVADQTLTVALKKSTGWTGSVTPDGTVVTAASYADGVITYTVAENKGSARDGSIMLTFKMDGKEDVVKTITVSQLGANDAPVEDPYEMGEGVSWTLGTNCYEEKVKVNGASTEYTSIRAGKSSAAGTITLKIPKGTTKLVFYAISWNGKEATMTIKNGDESLFNQKVRAESGLANSSPYSITVSETDCYTIDFGSALTAETSLTVTTTGSNYRVALFGIKAK